MRHFLVLALLSLSLNSFAQNIEGLWVATVDVSKTCLIHGEAFKDILTLIRIKKIEDKKYSVESSWKCFGKSETLATYESGALVFFAEDDLKLNLKITDSTMEGIRILDINGTKAETKILNAVKISSDPNGIKLKREKLNKYVSFSNFYTEYSGCTYLASVTSGKTQQVSFIVTKDLNKGRVPFKGLEVCHTTDTDYAVVFSALWDEVTAEFLTKKGIKIDQFAFGSVKRNPLEKDWAKKLALMSVNDPDFKKIQKEGEKKITLNQVMAKFMKEGKLAENVISVHKRIGMFLEYEGVEKVFRDKVKSSPVKDELIKAGLNENDRIISGAGIYYFKIN